MGTQKAVIDTSEYPPPEQCCVNACKYCSCLIDGGRCEYDEDRYETDEREQGY